MTKINRKTARTPTRSLGGGGYKKSVQRPYISGGSVIITSGKKLGESLQITAELGDLIRNAVRLIHSSEASKNISTKANKKIKNKTSEGGVIKAKPAHSRRDVVRIWSDRVADGSIPTDALSQMRGIFTAKVRGRGGGVAMIRASLRFEKDR